MRKDFILVVVRGLESGCLTKGMSNQIDGQVNELIHVSIMKDVNNHVDDLEKNCIDNNNNNNNNPDDQHHHHDDEHAAADDEDDVNHTRQRDRQQDAQCKTTLIDQPLQFSSHLKQQQNGYPDHQQLHQQLEHQHQICIDLQQHNDHLKKRVARLSQRLRWAVDTAQTHGQRLLRAAYQEKVRELNTEHTMKTTEMLNLQKRCFEEELEAMGSEHQAALQKLHKELETERALRIAAEATYARERDLALEATTSTMHAVQRRVTTLNARVGKLEREKKTLTTAVNEKQIMIELLANKAAAKDVERRRLEVLERATEEERIRKEGIVQRLQQDVERLTDNLREERTSKFNLLLKLDELEAEKVTEGTLGSDVSGKSDLDNKESS